MDAAWTASRVSWPNRWQDGVHDRPFTLQALTLPRLLQLMCRRPTTTGDSEIARIDNECVLRLYAWSEHLVYEPVIIDVMCTDGISGQSADFSLSIKPSYIEWSLMVGEASLAREPT